MGGRRGGLASQSKAGVRTWRRGPPSPDEPLESSAIGKGGWVSAKVSSKLMNVGLGLLDPARLRGVG